MLCYGAIKKKREEKKERKEHFADAEYKSKLGFWHSLPEEKSKLEGERKGIREEEHFLEAFILQYVTEFHYILMSLAKV